MADSLILTTAGLAKLAIASPESPVQISHLAVGDGGGGYPAMTPSWTALANEVWRGTASEPIREPGNPTVLKFETVIPSEDGGFFIREIGLFDSTGTLIAVAQCSVVEKPGALSSTALTMTVAMRLTLANAAQTQVVVSDTPYIDHGGLSGRSTANAHPISAITGLQTALDGKVSSGDSRLSNAREWTASEVSQSEAEAGTAATPRKWTAQRVRQAIAAAFTSLGHSALGGRNDANAHPMAAISGMTGKQAFNATESLSLPATIAGAVSLKSTAYNMRATLPKVADLPRAVEVTLYLSHDSTHPVMVRASAGDTLNMPDDVKYDSVPGEIILRPTGGWVTLRSIAGAGWEVVASNIHLRDPNEFKRGMPLTATNAEVMAGDDYSKMVTPAGLGSALVGLGVDVRQTVLSGPVDGNGNAAFLPSTSATLSLTSTGINASTPLFAAAANGYSRKGASNSIGIATANLTWTGLTANTTNYLFVDIAPDGTITPAHSTLAPIYQFGGARSTVNGQFVFNYGDMKSPTVGNGSAAVPIQRVCVGEALTNATGVVSAVSYAYQGRTVIETSQLANNSVLSHNHKIGALPVVGYSLRCISPVAGYSVGQEIPRWIDGVTGVADATVCVAVDRAVVRGLVGNNNIAVGNFATGATTSAAVSSFTLISRVSRGW